MYCSIDARAENDSEAGRRSEISEGEDGRGGVVSYRGNSDVQVLQSIVRLY